MNEDILQIYEAVLDIVGLLNQPQRDTALIREAGVSIDRALFPLLVVIERRGPLKVVDLAGLVGRDYTTVSRQTARLESLELITRRTNPRDQRVTEMAVTPKGKEITAALDRARERLLGLILQDWSESDRKSLAVLLRRFADNAKALDLKREGPDSPG
jgi:DNA-binding MarR family transcriptional regulator